MESVSPKLGHTHHHGQHRHGTVGAAGRLVRDANLSLKCSTVMASTVRLITPWMAVASRLSPESIAWWVSDAPEACDVIAEMLRQEGHRVIMAGDAGSP